MDQPPDHRAAARLPLTLRARCRTPNGLRDDCLLTDLSTRGCCVTAHSLSLQVGMRLTIRPAGLEGLTGVVRWVERQRAGVEFDQPMYPAVVAHLGQRFGDEG